MSRTLIICAFAACAPALPETLVDGLNPVTLTRSCPDGFTASGDACDAVLPETECGAGTMPVLGSTTCAGVGNTTCAAGFVADPSGWGCTDVLPPAKCTGATFEVLGKTSCQRVSECGEPFPPADATLFVDDDGPADATHFLTLTAAVDAAPDGAVIAVERGVYIESLRLARKVTLHGRCAAEVTLRGPPNTPITGLEVLADVTLRGLTVTRHWNGALVRPSGHLTVEQSVFEANVNGGINSYGRLDVSDTVVRDGVPNQTGNWGSGLYLGEGSTNTAKRVAIVGNSRLGIIARDLGTTLTLEDSVVRETRPRADTSAGGFGVVVSFGAVANIKRTALVANSEVGLLVESDTDLATAIVEDSVVRDTKPLATPIVDPLNPANLEYQGMNVGLNGPAALTMKRSTLARAGGNSVVVSLGSRVDLSDSTVFTSQPFPNGYGTAGLLVAGGATVDVRRTAVVQSSAVGAQVYSAALHLEDSLITQTQSVGPRHTGDGLAIAEDAIVTLTRSALTANVGAGMVMANDTPKPPSRCTVTASVVGWNSGFPDGTFGRGVDIFKGSIFEMDGSAIVHNHEIGLVVDASTVRVTRSVISDTRADGAQKTGRGINVQLGGRLELVDSLLAGNRDVGIMVALPGSTAVLTDTVVRDTRGRDLDGKFGIGLCALKGGRIDLTRSQVSSNAFIGLAAGDAAATLSGSVLAHNPVALQVQDGSTVTEVETVPDTVGAQDVLVTHDTRFEENAVKLGTGSVPLPAAL